MPCREPARVITTGHHFMLFILGLDAIREFTAFGKVVIGPDRGPAFFIVHMGIISGRNRVGHDEASSGRGMSKASYANPASFSDQRGSIALERGRCHQPAWDGLTATKGGKQDRV